MKYIITESQLDNVIFSYLNIHKLIRTEKDGKIYFKRPEADNALIIYDIESGVCKLGSKVINEISIFFSMDKSEAKEYIGRWVEKTLKKPVSSIAPISAAHTRFGK
jgi:hypothetical protein